MELLKAAIRTLIRCTDDELDQFVSQCRECNFRKGDILLHPGSVPREVIFVNQGILRVVITDNYGVSHTIHFASEYQFITDYSSFLRERPAMYALEAIEPLSTVLIPRSAVMWGYENLKEGQKLGRLIAEYYFIYQDQRIMNGYALSPKERYDSITDIFPNIHNRVPQHMIASYLGVTPVHLSRLKRESR